MITLGGVAISDDMYLGGLETAPENAINQVRDENGVSFVFLNPSLGGRTLTLGTTSGNGSIQGFWCQSVIDKLKVLEKARQALTLNYHGDIYTVAISGTSSLVQFLIWEPVHPNKTYTGNLTLIEV